MGKKKAVNKNANDKKNRAPRPKPEDGIGPYVSVGIGLWVAALAVIAAVYTPSFLARNGQYGTFDATVGPPKTSPPAEYFTTPRNARVEERRKAAETRVRETKQTLNEAVLRHLANVEYPCNTETLLEYLHVQKVPGMHLFCLEAVPDTDDSSDDRNAEPKALRLSMYEGSKGKVKNQNSTANNSPDNIFVGSHLVELDVWTWDAIQMSFNATLPDMMDQFRSGDHNRQPWAIYSPVGERLIAGDWGTAEDGKTSLDGVKTKKDIEDVVQNELPRLGMFLVLEGGQWVWPGVREGFKRKVVLTTPGNDNAEDDATHRQTVTLETVSLRPLVISVEGFLTFEECDFIQKHAEPNLRYSSVTLMDKDKGRPSSDFRTSQSTFLSSKGRPELEFIEHKTSSLVRHPIQHQEYAQVLKYGLDEKYDAHLDYFDPNMYQNDKGTMRTTQNGRRNRMITVFWYLTDVDEGGETVFPKTPDGNQHFDNNVSNGICDTEDVLKVKPQRGKVIIFYSMTPDGEMDSYSLHGACPVKQGTKWAANKWIWNEPMNYMSRSTRGS